MAKEKIVPMKKFDDKYEEMGFALNFCSSDPELKDLSWICKGTPLELRIDDGRNQIKTPIRLIPVYVEAKQGDVPIEDYNKKFGYRDK